MIGCPLFALQHLARSDRESAPPAPWGGFEVQHEQLVMLNLLRSRSVT